MIPNIPGEAGKAAWLSKTIKLHFSISKPWSLFQVPGKQNLDRNYAQGNNKIRQLTLCILYTCLQSIWAFCHLNHVMHGVKKKQEERKGLHQKMAITNLVVCPISPEKSDKTHFNWAADVQGLLEPPLPYTVWNNEAPQTSHNAMPMGPLCKGSTALLKMGSMGS